ncbi:MAG: succinate dehydrogenase iron-sulfur subunit [Polyangiaceae bacterium]
MAGPKSKRAKGAPKEQPEESAEAAGEAADTDEARLPAAVRVRLPARVTRERERPAHAGKTVKLRIRRQDNRDHPETRRWEEFEVPWTPHMNVHTALEMIRRNPVTTSGETVSPPVWEASCLEEVCGSCTMLVNGRVRQACSTLVDDVAPKGQRVQLEPLSKFPCERDLVVDRSRMFESLKQVKAWIELDGSHAIGPGPRESQEEQSKRYPLSRCMSCGSCLEACPEYGENKRFIGPAAINQVRLMNLHPSGKMHAGARLEALMGDGGIADCGKAQNCVEVCPKEIPLVDSIGSVARDTTKRMLFGWFLG